MNFPAKEELIRKDATAKEAAFKTFMAQPIVRLLISKLPSTEPELLETLLQDAHSSGWSGGSGHNAVSMLEIIMKQDMKRP